MFRATSGGDMDSLHDVVSTNPGSQTTELALAEPIVGAPPEILDQPHISLKQWRAFENPLGKLLLTGISPDTGAFRVTSPMEYWSAEQRCMISATGRCYFFEHPPATEEMAQVMVFQKHAAIPRLAQCRDVTQRIVAEMKAAQQG